MHLPNHDIAQDDWPEVKSLWFAVQDGLNQQRHKQVTQTSEPVEVKA